MISILAGLSLKFGGLLFIDIVYIWIYNIISLILVDLMKVAYLACFQENLEIIVEETVLFQGDDRSRAPSRASREAEVTRTEQEQQQLQGAPSIPTTTIEDESLRIQQLAVEVHRHRNLIKPSMDFVLKQEKQLFHDLTRL